MADVEVPMNEYKQEDLLKQPSIVSTSNVDVISRKTQKRPKVKIKENKLEIKLHGKLNDSYDSNEEISSKTDISVKDDAKNNVVRSDNQIRTNDDNSQDIFTASGLQTHKPVLPAITSGPETTSHRKRRETDSNSTCSDDDISSSEGGEPNSNGDCGCMQTVRSSFICKALILLAGIVTVFLIAFIVFVAIGYGRI